MKTPKTTPKATKTSEAAQQLKDLPRQLKASEQLEELEHRLRLMVRTWQGDASRHELHGAAATDGLVCGLHNCAMDLDGLLTKRA